MSGEYLRLHGELGPPTWWLDCPSAVLQKWYIRHLAPIFPQIEIFVLQNAFGENSHIPTENPQNPENLGNSGRHGEEGSGGLFLRFKRSYQLQMGSGSRPEKNQHLKITRQAIVMAKMRSQRFSKAKAGISSSALEAPQN